MSRFVHIEYPAQHAGVARMERSAEVVRGWHLGHAVLHALAVVGGPFRAAYARWAESRRQAEHDRKLWEVALQDARVMADLSRAMSAAASEDLRKYY